MPLSFMRGVHLRFHLRAAVQKAFFPNVRVRVKDMCRGQGRISFPMQTDADTSSSESHVAAANR